MPKRRRSRLPIPDIHKVHPKLARRNRGIFGEMLAYMRANGRAAKAAELEELFGTPDEQRRDPMVKEKDDADRDRLRRPNHR